MDVKNMLANSLEELMSVKFIDDLHVNEIVEHVGLSRQTFYRHFIDKYDLLSWTFKKIHRETVDKILEGMCFSDALLTLFDVFETKLTFLQNAFPSIDLNGLSNSSCTIAMELAINIVKTKGVDTSEPGIRFMLEVYIRGCNNVMISWIMNGMKTPKTEMVKMFKRSCPAELADYFD